MNYTLEEILEAWDSSYGENMTVEYPGFFEILKDKEKTKENDMPYEIGDEYDEIYAKECPNCKAVFDEEHYFCEGTDHWGREYEAACADCGYFAKIDIKHILVEQGIENPNSR